MAKNADRGALLVNRAPVLTLWAAIVAERLGFDRDTALTLGKAVAGLNAQAKGRRLGIYGPPKEERAKPPQKPALGEEFRIELLGRGVEAIHTDLGLRALIDGSPQNPRQVETYLRGKFGDRFADAQAAMRDLARSMEPEELSMKAYDLYEQFRPEIPSGAKGWGAKGELDLEYVRSLAGVAKR